MGDKSGSQLCSACNNPARSNAKLHTCDNCKKRYHPNCSKLATVTFDDNKQGKACPSCISKTVPSDNFSSHSRVLRRSNSLSACGSSSPRLNTSTTANSSPQTSTASDPMQTVLAEILKLNSSIDKRFDALSSDVNSRFDTLADQIQALDVPGIVARIDTAEAGLNEVKHNVQEVQGELADIKKKIDTLDSSVIADQLPLMLERISKLEKKNAEVSSRIDKVSSSSLSSSKRVSTSTDLIIGGLTVPSGADLKKLMAAVLGLVHRDFDIRDIESARLLVSKTMLATAVRDAASSSSPNTVSGASHGNSTQGQTTAKPTVARTARPPSILVTLKSRSTLLAIINDKIKMGKLHTSALASVLPDDVDFSSIKPDHINVNEFLPKDVFKLRQEVYIASRRPNSGFVSFVRDGNIYVRRKRGDIATVINSMADLNRFLEL